jgi:hypothetical protein
VRVFASDDKHLGVSLLPFSERPMKKCSKTSRNVLKRWPRASLRHSEERATTEAWLKQCVDVEAFFSSLDPDSYRDCYFFCPVLSGAEASSKKSKTPILKARFYFIYCRHFSIRFVKSKPNELTFFISYFFLGKKVGKKQRLFFSCYFFLSQKSNQKDKAKRCFLALFNFVTVACSKRPKAL